MDKPSALGNHSDEVIDTKLGRHAKAAYVLQLAFYGDLVASVQQAEPHEMHVVLGTREQVSFTCSEYSRYFRRLLQRFRIAIGAPPTETYLRLARSAARAPGPGIAISNGPVVARSSRDSGVTAR